MLTTVCRMLTRVCEMLTRICRCLLGSARCHLRLCESFESACGASLASATFAHGLEPHWPLCPFESNPRGACHNAACGFQMTLDYWLPPVLALEDVYKLASRSVYLPAGSLE